MVTRRFAVPARQLWPWLTDPALLSRWGARVVGTRVGMDGTYASEGATRTVFIKALWMTVAAHEVVVAADPPHRFAYRVVRGGGLRRHRGTLSIQEQAGVSELCWSVDLATYVPGASGLVRSIVRPQLVRGLETLAQCLERADRSDPAGADPTEGA